MSGECRVCQKSVTVKDAVFCNECFYSGRHMEEALRKGITLEYIDGTKEVIKKEETQ